MSVILKMFGQKDTWPPCVINFDRDEVEYRGIWGFNDALTKNHIKAKISYELESLKNSDFRYILEFESNEDYVEFMLRWS